VEIIGLLRVPEGGNQPNAAEHPEQSSGIFILSITSLMRGIDLAIYKMKKSALGRIVLSIWLWR
jgi:hypothetical protein